MKRISTIAISALMSLSLAEAHHSLAGVYETNREVTLEGVVTEFHFVNPHPFVLIDVRANNGSTQWKLEMDNRSELVEVGVSSATIKPGDRITVSGNPSRGQSPSLYIRRLARP